MTATWITLGIAASATLLLISGRVRSDVVGLLVAASLALTGLIPAKAALGGLVGSLVYLFASLGLQVTEIQQFWMAISKRMKAKG